MKKLPRNKAQLARAYKIDPRTLAKWLRPIEKKIGKYTGTYTPKQIIHIYQLLGWPNK
jgi:hypothetical protein